SVLPPFPTSVHPTSKGFEYAFQARFTTDSVQHFQCLYNSILRTSLTYSTAVLSSLGITASKLSLRRLTSLSLPPPSMDNLPHESADSTTNSTPHDLESHSQGSVMFSGNQAFTVNGGTFTSVTNQYPASAPSDFRMIPLGDIDLRHEIQVDSDKGVVGRQGKRICARRIYTAKVAGHKSKVTVAMYQGNSAEEEWRRDIAKYMSIRHPNLIQIYGAASSGDMYATLYHDELVPFQQYVDGYQYSHFATVYIYACCIPDFCAANNHVYSTFQRPLTWDYTVWMRCSSGQLCVELVPPSTPQPNLDYPAGISRSHIISSLSDTKLRVVQSLTMKEYHNICGIYLSQFRTISISTSTTVNVGAIISCSPGPPLEDPVEIAYVPNVHPRVSGWQTSGGAEGVVMEDGGMRFKSDDIFNGIIELYIWSSTWRPWLSQANNIFRRLQITSNFKEYVCVRDVSFELEASGTTEEPPAGFLFLCSQKDLKTSPSTYCWPDCPAYWSFDPSGVDRLTLKEAIQLGFPAFQLKTTLYGHSWDTSVYEGLQKFHQGKGFDPDTQDLARDIGYPLYELSSKADSTFAHVNEGNLEEIDQEYWDAEDKHESDDPLTETSAGEDVDGNTEVSYSN
ncbi:hypothetical protein DFH08DRAFT_419117, partial [Mycena albidolilacea]